MDTPTGIGWTVVLPNGKSVLIKFSNGEWKTEENSNISHEFWQTVGNEINLLLKADLVPRNSAESYSGLPPRPKRTRMQKYSPI